MYEITKEDGVIFRELQEEWGYAEANGISVVTKLSGNGGNSHGFIKITECYHPTTGAKLPIEDEYKIFIPKKFNQYASKWVQLDCKLSPISERIKHMDESQLNAVNVFPLTSLPPWLKNIEVQKLLEIHNPLGSNGERVASLVREDYLKFIKDTFESEYEKQQELYEKKLKYIQDSLYAKQLEENEKQQKAYEKQQKNLEKKLEKQLQELQVKENDEKEIINSIKNLTIKYSEIEEELEGKKLKTEKELHTLLVRCREEKIKVDELKKYIKEKTQQLVNLDLLDEQDVHRFIEKTPRRKAIGYSFTEALDGNLKNLAAFVQKFSFDKGFLYRRRTIEDFIALLLTNDLIVLAGDSGTGKSSLVKMIAEALDGSAIVVPVKPNWTSNEDLMGYYNPIEHKFLSTQFLEALKTAESDPQRLYFICLDEMNIARVEYYFADFLSLLEDRSKQPCFLLFSDADESSVVSEISNFEFLAGLAMSKSRNNLKSFRDMLQDDDSRESFKNMCGLGEAETLLRYHAQLKARLKSITQSPSKITLPNNVRIIGTVNVDDTTYYLSPKILDRVNIIRFSSESMPGRDEIEEELDQSIELDEGKPVSLKPRELGERTEYPKVDETNPCVTYLKKLSHEFLSPLGIEFGYRGLRQALCYREKMLMFTEDDRLILDHIIQHKILPKLVLNGKKSKGNIEHQDRLEDMLINLSSELGAESGCVKELSRILDAAKSGDGYVNYWIK